MVCITLNYVLKFCSISFDSIGLLLTRRLRNQFFYSSSNIISLQTSVSDTIYFYIFIVLFASSYPSLQTMLSP